MTAIFKLKTPTIESNSDALTLLSQGDHFENERRLNHIGIATFNKRTFISALWKQITLNFISAYLP